MSGKNNYKYAMDAAARSTMKRLDPAEIINASMEKRNRKEKSLKKPVVAIIAVCVLILGCFIANNAVTGMRNRSIQKTVENDVTFSEIDSEKTIVLPEKTDEAHVIMNDISAKTIKSLPAISGHDDYSFEYGLQFGDTLEMAEKKVRKVDPKVEDNQFRPYDYGGSYSYKERSYNREVDFYKIGHLDIEDADGRISMFFEKNDDVPGTLIGVEYWIFCGSKDLMTPNNFMNVNHPMAETYDYYLELLTQKYGNPISETSSYSERISVKGFFAVMDELQFEFINTLFPDSKHNMSIDDYAEWLIPTDDGGAVKIEIGTVETHQLIEKGEPPYLWSETYACYIDYTIVPEEEYQVYLNQ